MKPVGSMPSELEARRFLHRIQICDRTVVHVRGVLQRHTRSAAEARINRRPCTGGRSLGDGKLVSPSSGRLFTIKKLLNRFTFALLVSVPSVGIASTAYAQSKTREQVLQELQQSRAAVLITYCKQAYAPVCSHTSSKTRPRAVRNCARRKLLGL